MRYFIDPPDPQRLSNANLKAIFGGIGLVLGLLLLTAGSGSTAFLGFVFLVGGIVLAVNGMSERRKYNQDYARAIPRPSDQDMDQLLGTDTLSILNRTLPQLGLSHSDLVAPRGVTATGGSSFDQLADSVAPTESAPQPPGASQLAVWGPAFPCHSAIGNDGRIRYSKYEFMVICPTTHMLAVYRCELDLYTGGLRSEQTYEFHYADVVAVRTATKPLVRHGIPLVPRPSQAGHYRLLDTERTMEIVVSSGDRAAITLGVSSSAELAVDRSDSLDFPDVLQRVRQMLREKKGGTYDANTHF
ncbi:hypothetical protein [Streptomyces sp. NPDC085596]|uniref:hypothetical protein n=1 Tax=Streptomyces sp. NPDC085596 TaxID=3365731 RepID=UPI0037CF34AB